MYPSVARDHLTLIIVVGDPNLGKCRGDQVEQAKHLSLLLVSMKRADSLKMNMERRSADSSDPEALGSPGESPYWEYILREFLFKTISPPPPSNNILYKELLEAPFYRGPFPAPGSFGNGETDQVLSRGDVYHLVRGGWIICQEGCADCEICTVQKARVVPTVKWILRRIERRVPFPISKRHDLELTVLPQADGSFHMKNLSPGPYVYVTSNSRALAGLTDTLIRKNKEYPITYPFAGTIPTERKNPGDVSFGGKDQRSTEKVVTQVPVTDDEVFPTEAQPKMTSTLIPQTQGVPGRKRGREVLRDGENQRKIDEELDLERFNTTESSTPLTPFHHTVQEIDADCEAGIDTRLILGRDQFGVKHIVHVVPAGDLDAGINAVSVHPAALFIHQELARPPHPLQIEYEERPLYRKIFRRVMDSLNTHRNAIEKFLFSSKPEARFGQGPFLTSTAGAFDEGGKAALNNEEINTVGTADKSEGNDNRGEIIARGGEPSSISTATYFPTEEDGYSTESDHGTAQVTQESNNHLSNFDQRNSERSSSDEVMKLGNNSETLIFKEVAKSVVNRTDTLQGFNPASNTSLHHDSVRSISDGATRRDEYSNGGDKTRRNA